jgi:hypothetical protein
MAPLSCQKFGTQRRSVGGAKLATAHMILRPVRGRSLCGFARNAAVAQLLEGTIPGKAQRIVSIKHPSKDRNFLYRGDLCCLALFGREDSQAQRWHWRRWDTANSVDVGRVWLFSAA